MSFFPISPGAGESFPAVPSRKSPALIFEHLATLPKPVPVALGARLEARPVAEMVSSGNPALDALTGGLPRGCLSEICGATSSGRTSVLLAALAAATQRGEACALVDVSDAFNPVPAAGAGVDFDRLLWVRCHGKSPQRRRVPEKSPDARKMEAPVEQALRVTDLLLQSGGFGLVMIDLGDVPFPIARRIPLTSWFRFQRVVERTPTVLFLITPAPCAQTCASLLLKVQAKSLAAGRRALEKPAHAQLLDGLQVEGELLRSRLQRKPSGSVSAAFSTKALPVG